MAEPRKRSSRRQTIEPLNYAEAALAPALKGMTSFLDLSPEDVRRGNFTGLVRTAERGGGGRVLDESSPGHVAATIQQSFVPESLPNPVNPFVLLTMPGDETLPKEARARTSLPTTKDVSSPGNERTSETIDRLGAPSDGAEPVESQQVEKRPGRSSAVTRSDLVLGSVNELGPVLVDELAHVSSPAADTSRLKIAEQMALSLSALVPGRGRSGVRRCLLAQDGHSLGEEAIYQLLWKQGDPESADPNSSRTVQMGASEIGLKMNMAKKNVRQNIARLFEKLAIEIVEDFATMTSQARMYRVFSSRQILQRRRAVGMEYVLRNKGVVFCEQNGTDPKISPAYEIPPGDETRLQPARPRRRRRRIKTAVLSAHLQVLHALEGRSEPWTDVEVVLGAFEPYAAVEPGLAEQLIEDCRRVRDDARADEVAFLVREKLSVARSTRSMGHLVSLVLATVPQAFADGCVEEFRQRLARHMQFASEEADWARREAAELRALMTRERDALIELASDASVSEETRLNAEWELRQRDWGV